MKICNVSAVPQMVKLDMADGSITEIRVMPKARPSLPPGAKVNARWLASNPRTIHILEEPRPLNMPKDSGPKNDKDKE